MSRVLIACAAVLFAAGTARGDHLLYLESQAVAGYDSGSREAIFYSQNPDAEMQRPSIGLDYLHRFSGETGDVATLALQLRLAGKAEEPISRALEPQVYNAYVKAKTPLGYAWVGHNRPAFGLSSYFDSHGLLLRTLAIQGFGYDRDWGAGFYRDFTWGDVSASVTTGTGMPVRLSGNYMAAARASFGVQSQESFNLGFSVGYGATLDTMGYRVREPDPRRMRLIGVDLTVLLDNLEHRFDLYSGTWLGQKTFAASYRLGLNLDQEGRLKLEAQPTYWRTAEENDFEAAVCVSSLVTSNLTIRLAYTYTHDWADHRLLLQLYYYRPT